jgi:hypothetical protein
MVPQEEKASRRRKNSMSAENEALVRRYVEEVYDQRKLGVVDEIFASNTSLSTTPTCQEEHAAPRG